jgi:hypothetical protein
MDPFNDGMMQGQDGKWFSFSYYFFKNRVAYIMFFEHGDFRTPPVTKFFAPFVAEERI